MTIEDIKYFKTKEGLELIEKYKHLTDDELEMLAFSLVKKGTPHYQYLISLLKLRKKAREKFSKADKMFFDTLSLEMATSEKIADHIARRFTGMKKIVDLTCGIGGNSISFAKNSKVVAVDLEETSIEMARQNAEAYGVSDKIEFRVGNAFFHLDEDSDAFFIDPMRAREGESKTRSLRNSRPEIFDLLPRIFKVTKNVCIKISPAFDYKELQDLPEIPEIELISDNFENKVALLWFGAFKKTERRATMFIGEDFVEMAGKGIVICPISKPGDYIYEPNKAITKAHLVDELALEQKMEKIHSKIAFLTNNREELHDKYKYRTFKNIKYGQYSLKSLRNDLKVLGIERAGIINRGTPIDPTKLARDIKIKEGNEFYVLLTKLEDNKNYYIVSKRLFSQY